MFLNILVLTVVLLSLAFLGLALNILVKKNGHFPEHHIGHNREMKKLGINCAKQDELRCLNGKLKDQSCAGCQQLNL